VRESRRAWLWGVWLPLACAASVLAFGQWGLLALLIYPLQLVRRMTYVPGRLSERLLLILFEMLGRFPETYGQVRFMIDQMLSRNGQLIEYK
jgi:hypothetical protein